MSGMDQEHLERGDHVFCPVNATLDLLSQRWNLRIVRTLLGGTKRFNEIARAHGINPRTLRERLRDMESKGVVKRDVISEMPPNVEYSLTEKGQALNEIFEALVQWGLKWMDPPSANSSCPDEENGADNGI